MTLLIALLSVFICVGPAHADHDDVDEYAILPIANRLQETPVWCWVAVSEQVIAYSRGNSPRQCALVAVANNSPPVMCCGGYNPACVRTGTMDQVRTLLLAYGNNASDVIAPPRDPRVLFDRIVAGQPVILQVRVGGTATHVIVLKGVELINGRAYMTVNDPMSVYTTPVDYAILYPKLINALIVY
jgi:hypothetical protein